MFTNKPQTTKKIFAANRFEIRILILLILILPTDIIPHFCKEGKNEITLDATGNSSVARIGINVPKGVEVIPNYLCYFTVASPPGTGLILTIRHASLNERDEIKIKSGNNIDRVWQRGVADSSKDVQLDNVATVPQRDYPSSMFVSYRPAAGRSEFNAGLDMAVTVFRGL